MTSTPYSSQVAATSKPTIRGLWWKVGTGLWMALAILAAFLRIGPAEGFRYPEGARIIVFHVPCAWLASLAYVVAAWYASRFLIDLRRVGRANLESDLKCASAMELGLMFSLFTTVTGMIFSQLQWGAFWSWDPRQTSILIILLIFAAYLVLRGAIDDPEARARLCSVYALVAIVPGTFLIWVLPRIVYTLHIAANNAVIGGQISGNYRSVMYGFAVPAFLALFIWLFQVRLRILKLEARHDTAP